MPRRDEVLITVDELEGRLEDPSIKVVEVDEDITLYEKGHVAGAVSWDWAADLHEPLRREFIGEEELVELLTRSGIGEGDTVVLYAGNNNWFAAYAYWLLKYRGFDDVKLLDGGRKKWELESKELTADLPTISQISVPVRLKGTRPELRAFRDEVIQEVPARSTKFVDVRSPEEFRGELLAPPHLPQEQAQVPGHIPTAVNVPWSKAANEDGTFKSDDDLRQLYAAAGVSDADSVTAYCRIGERSSHTWFVLREILGFEKVKNYDGSWTEYGSLVGAQVER